MEKFSLSFNSAIVILSRTGHQRNNCYAANYGSPVFMVTVPNKKLSQVPSRISHDSNSSNHLSFIPLRTNGEPACYKK